jgi:hypothetical protein
LIGGVLWSVAFVGAVLTLLCPLVAGLGSVLSVASGAALAVANLWVLSRVVRGFLAKTGPKLPWAALAFGKFSLLLGTVYILVDAGWVQLLPLLIGFGALPLGIVLSVLRSSPPEQSLVEGGGSGRDA